MPVKKESSMGLKEQKGYVRRKKPKMEVHGDSTLTLHGRAAEGFGPEKRNGEFSAGGEELQDGLHKLEQDVAEALADFWRIAQLQTQKNSRSGFVAGLQWFGKRSRSGRFDKNVVNPSGSVEEPEDALSSAKRSKPACILDRASSASDRDEIESSGVLLKAGKECSNSESRAESPSSPLLSLHQSCKDFLVGRSPVAKSDFLRVVPLRPLPEPCLIQVKTELEDMNMGSPFGRPRKMPAKCKSPPQSAPSVKTELLLEQVVYAHDMKVQPSACHMPADLESVPFAISTSKPVGVDQDGCLGVLKRQKAGMSEEEKEARRQRRVQANRESARQTIRRKQILCEELTRKAASLTLDNKGMKQKRDLLLQELVALKGQNVHLRQQLESNSPGTFGLDPLQPTSFSSAGVPVQCFVWALPVAQAATRANQTTMFHNKDHVDATLDNSSHRSTTQIQAAGVVVSHVLPVTNRLDSSEQCSGQYHGGCPASSHGLPHLETGAIEGVSGESGTCQSAPLANLDTNKACDALSSSPSTGLSHIEKGYSKEVSREKVTLQGEGSPDSTTMTNDERDPALVKAVDPPTNDVSMEARCSWSQPMQFTSLAGKSGRGVANGTGLQPESRECLMGPQIPLALGCGYPFSGSRVGGSTFPTKGQSFYMGRNSIAAMVAAEARRRRKELTRSKFSRAGAVRPPHGRL